jgi:gamma-glutamylcyclotransferase (GGCT)/AIG2-like uncharacterized protein YtfP
LTLEPRTRLATYGTLSPGQSNHHQLDGLEGVWTQGTVRGQLHASGWGAAIGFPGLVVDPSGPEVPVQVFESADLPAHWPRLDAFEGEGYRRVIVEVATENGPVLANLYALADRP